MEFSSRFRTVQGQESIVSEAVLLPVDAGTPNAVVAHDHRDEREAKALNIADFKSELTEGLV
jgi:hypothetical protein